MIDWAVIEEFYSQTGWMRDAACQNVDTDIFFVGQGKSAAAAKNVCAACPVRNACLDFAVAHNLRFGIFGGLTPKQRRAHTRTRAQAS